MIRFFFAIYTLLVCTFFTSLANSSTTSSSYLIANTAISFNDYETAAEYYSKNMFFDFNINELKKKLIAFINVNDLEQAVLVAKKIIKLDKYNEDAWIVYLINAKIKNQLNKFNDLESLDFINQFNILYFIFYKNGQLKKDNEDIAEALLNIISDSNSLILKQQQSIDYLLFYLSLALNLKPNFNEALFFQAQLFQQLKYYEKAEKIYRYIELNHPLYLEAQKNIAINKKNTGKFDEAKKILTNLINLNPDNNSFKILLADLFRSNKQFNKAIKYYTFLLNKKDIENNQLWRIFYMRGICFERSKEWKKAEKDFLIALEIKPNQPQVLNYLAYGWIERNILIDKSLEMLELAAKNEPDSFYILDSLAWAYYKKNNFLRALKIMEDVIRLAPGEAISLDHLGDIYFALGRKREAYFMWTQAQDLAEPEDGITDSVQLKIKQFNAG